MQVMGAMKLGEIVRVATEASDLRATLAFYAKLGFKEVGESFGRQTTALLDDGMITLSVRRGDEPRTELTYFTSKIDEKITGLAEAGIEFDKEEGGALGEVEAPAQRKKAARRRGQPL